MRSIGPLMAACLAAACTTSDIEGELSLESIQPASAPAGQSVTVTIQGSYSPSVVVSYDDADESGIVREFEVELGGTALEDISLVSDTTITATVPGTLAEGTYDLLLRDPAARTAELAGAFVVGTAGNICTDTCTADCAICDLACSTNDTSCDGVSCQGATSCEVACSGNAVCDVACDGATTCAVHCSGNSSCDLDCTGATDCDGSTCSSNGGCRIVCGGSDPCGFENCSGGEMTCADGSVVCGRACP